MPTLHSLLSRDYFPKEIPPSFTTQSFADVVDKYLTTLPAGFIVPRPKSSHQSKHNLARAGTLRRKLSIPNPINFARLAICVAQAWPQLLSLATSSISLSGPLDGLVLRSIEPQNAPPTLPSHRIRTRAMARYMLKADVTRCYPSTYTHSVPWAIHTKSVAKTHRNDFSLIGNVIDREIRESQDSQTVGLPIGPDTSFLIGEIILSAVDNVLLSRTRINGFRYLDDYEFSFKTLAEAEGTRSLLEESLNQYELTLNPSKTEIVSLPQPFETPCFAELRFYPFRTNSASQHANLIHYFDRAFMLADENPNEGVMKYAIKRLGSVPIQRSNWSLFENLLLQCALTEPGTLPFILNQFRFYQGIGFPINLMNIGDLMNQLVDQHAPLNHGSEVAWAIWGSIFFGTSIDLPIALTASQMNDAVVGLLLLDARSRGIIPRNTAFPLLEQYMTSDDLYGEQWLLSYEANIKNWLPTLGGGDHVSSNTEFGFLKNNNVSFYTQLLPPTPAPSYSSSRFTSISSSL